MISPIWLCVPISIVKQLTIYQYEIHHLENYRGENLRISFQSFILQKLTSLTSREIWACAHDHSIIFWNTFAWDTQYLKVMNILQYMRKKSTCTILDLCSSTRGASSKQWKHDYLTQTCWIDCIGSSYIRYHPYEWQTTIIDVEVQSESPKRILHWFITRTNYPVSAHHIDPTRVERLTYEYSPVGGPINEDISILSAHKFYRIQIIRRCTYMRHTKSK